jgi:mannose-6-phosphate isomerase class I
VLCAGGTATLRSGAGCLKLAGGESCYIPASDGPVAATGSAALFIAAIGTAAGTLP